MDHSTFENTYIFKPLKIVYISTCNSYLNQDDILYNIIC